MWFGDCVGYKPDQDSTESFDFFSYSVIGTEVYGFKEWLHFICRVNPMMYRLLGKWLFVR